MNLIVSPVQKSTGSLCFRLGRREFKKIKNYSIPPLAADAFAVRAAEVGVGAGYLRKNQLLSIISYSIRKLSYLETYGCPVEISTRSLIFLILWREFK